MHKIMRMKYKVASIYDDDDVSRTAQTTIVKNVLSDKVV